MVETMQIDNFYFFIGSFVAAFVNLWYKYFSHILNNLKLLISNSDYTVERIELIIVIKIYSAKVNA